MVDAHQTRMSGKTAGEEIAEELTDSDEPGEPQFPTERSTRFRRTGFSRMRTEWRPEDAPMIQKVREEVDEIIDRLFYDAFVIVNNLYDLVREKDTHPDGTVVTDRFGWPMWKRSDTGGYVEDWDRLSLKEREKYLFQLTTMLFEWEQRGADLWAEAMYTKGMWEDAFSAGYEDTDASPISTKAAKDTIDARTARGRLEAQEERYFAIFKSHVSRRADAIVKSTNALALRLKDTLPQR